MYEVLTYIPDARVVATAYKHVPVRHDARSRMDHLVAHILFDALIVDWHTIGEEDDFSRFSCVGA